MQCKTYNFKMHTVRLILITYPLFPMQLLFKTILTLSFSFAQAYAMQPNSQEEQPNILVSIAPFVLILLAFWFLMIRPQKKKAQQHQKTLAQLQKGDEVITSSGIVGTVEKLDTTKQLVWLEIAEKTTIRIGLNHISRILRARNANNKKAEKTKPAVAKLENSKPAAAKLENSKPATAKTAEKKPAKKSTKSTKNKTKKSNTKPKS